MVRSCFGGDPTRLPEPALATINWMAGMDDIPFDECYDHVGYWDGMDAEQTIAEIERLERILAVPDTRPLSSSDLTAANRRHDEMLAHSPWFRLWQQFGVCCRS